MKILLTKRPDSVKAMEEVQEICDNCELQGYITQNFPTILIFKEVLNERANAFNVISQHANNPYMSTYNIRLKNQSNLQ